MPIPATMANVQPQPEPDMDAADFLGQTTRAMALQEAVKSLLPSLDEEASDSEFDDCTQRIIRRAITFENYVLTGDVVMPDIRDQTEDEDADGRPA